MGGLDASILPRGGLNRTLIRSGLGIQGLRVLPWAELPDIITLWWGLFYDPVCVPVYPGDFVFFFFDHRGEMCFEAVVRAKQPETEEGVG